LNGNIVGQVNIPGNPFHNGNNDTFAVSWTLDSRNDATTGSVVDVSIVDKNTGVGYGATSTLPVGTIAASGLENTNVYAGFTGGTGGAASNQYINDWTVSTPPAVVATAPTVVSEVMGDGTTQRSTIYQMTVTFSEPVNFNESSYTLLQEATDPAGNLVVGPGTAVGGAGAATSGTTATSTDNTTWTITIKAAGSLDRSATIAAGPTNKGILINGIFQLVLHGAAITDAATSTATFNSGADAIVQYNSVEVDGLTGPANGVPSNYFHSLYGDTNGDGNVDLTDYRLFKTAYGSSSTDPNFVFSLDSNGDGNIDLTDYRAFKLDYGQSFSY